MRNGVSIFDNWFVKTWYGIHSWFRYTFDKYHIALVKEAFKGRPWDNGFLLDLEYAKIKEMKAYHERTRRFHGVEGIIRDMGICLSLIEIFTEKRSIYGYVGTLELVDVDKEKIGGLEEFSNDIIKGLRASKDFRYHCDVYVNTKNISRFVKNEKLIGFYTEHPHELYELKANYLYHKIRSERDGEWWD